jgi:hypothetical protein
MDNIAFHSLPARASLTKLPRLRSRRCCGEEDTAPRQKKPIRCRCQNSFRPICQKQCSSASATSTARRAPRSAMPSGDLRRRGPMRWCSLSGRRFSEFNREHRRRDRSASSKRFPEWPLPSLTVNNLRRLRLGGRDVPLIALSSSHYCAFRPYIYRHPAHGLPRFKEALAASSFENKKDDWPKFPLPPTSSSF